MSQPTDNLSVRAAEIDRVLAAGKAARDRAERRELLHRRADEAARDCVQFLLMADEPGQERGLCVGLAVESAQKSQDLRDAALA